MLPSVDVTIQRRGLNVVSTSSNALVVIGATSSGPEATPTPITSVNDLTATFGSHGEAVETAALAIGLYGLTAIVIRASAGDPGAVSDLTTALASGSTSVVSLHADFEPAAAYQPRVKITRAGTVGANSTVQYRTSLDDGRSYGVAKALGSATSITIGGAARFDLAAGTLAVADTFGATSTAPTADLASALEVLAASALSWRIAYFAGDLDANTASEIDAAFAAMRSRNKPRAWISHVRGPSTDGDSDETEGQYLTAQTAFRNAFTTVQGSLAAANVYQTSSVSGSDLVLPFGAPFAAFRASLRPDQNSAALRLGALVGTRLRDSNGNRVPGIHDELLNPGLSDLGFVVARSWEGFPGCYITLENLFSTPGEDFDIFVRRLVMDIAHEVLYGNLAYILSTPVRTNAAGTILEAEARSIEENALAALNAALASSPVMISGASVVLSRTDKILQTERIGVKARIQPLGYPRAIDLDLGYVSVLPTSAAA